MANVPLKSVMFPGLDNTYTVPQVDGTLSTAGAAADAKETGDKLNELKSDLSDVVHKGTTVVTSDLSTGKYYSMSTGKTPTEMTESESRYTETPIDLTGFVGGTLEIKVNSFRATSSRCFGFLDENGKVISYWLEKNAFEADGDYYVFKTSIISATFLFSIFSDVTDIKITPQITVYYSRAKTDEIVAEKQSSIDALERFVGVEDATHIVNGLSVTRLNFTRAKIQWLDATLVKSISAKALPATYQYSIYYADESETQAVNNGWQSQDSTFANSGYPKWRLEFRRADKGSFQTGDLDAIQSNLVCYATSKLVKTGDKTAYISTSGSDDNDGSSAHPYATINNALSSGANIILVNSGIYNQAINLSLSDSARVEIRNITTNGRVIFRLDDALIADAETAVSGYTKVYSCQSSKSSLATLKRIWQDGVADTRTLISDTDRHPLQRGCEYRMYDTKIAKCSSASLSDALTEIENDTGYKFFYDSANSTLYFSRPVTLSSEHPLMADFGYKLFGNADRSKTLKAYGIETKYMCFNIDGFSGAEVYDCKAVNVCAAGAFTYDKCISGKFVRCEAAGCSYGPNGDGFNGHSQNTGDALSKQTTVTLIDCWSHDNADDGYSDHERSETTIFGGLFEHNGKGGVVPSYGSHCTCYNVMSRNNYTGFFYTGTAEEAEGGKYGQMICYNCIAKDNTEVLGDGFRVDGIGNRAFLVNCKSVGNIYGYRTTQDAYMELMDCGSKNNQTNSSGNITLSNTNLVAM